MSNSMGLNIPTVSTTPGPEWATLINAALTRIAEHTHSSGDGVKVTPVGMNINSDLAMNGNDLTLVRSVRLSSQGAVLNEGTDIGCVVNVNGDLYWINNAGTPVQLTTGGAINIASVGTIGGDYGQPGVSASVAYSDTTKTFTFLQDSGEAAKLFVGTISVANEATGALSVQIGADAATSSYLIILPVSAPTDDSVLTFNSSGVGTFRNINGTSGEVNISSSSSEFTISLPSTITKNVTFSGDVSFIGSTSGRGILPLGSVIATMPYLTGAYNCTATTSADSNGFVQCNGQTISDVTSPMNGVVIPNINNNVFLMGNTTSGTTGGSNTKTLTTNELPAHTHTIDHGHSNSFGLTGTTTFAANGHTHARGSLHARTYHDVLSGGNVAWRYQTETVSAWTDNTNQFEVGVAGSTGAKSNTVGTIVSGTTDTNSSSASVGFSGSVTNHSGSSGSSGTGSSFDIRPSYITTKYIMRIR